MMNVIQAVHDYIGKMVDSVDGMKCFLLDDETAGIVSMVYPQSKILQKEVYLFRKIYQDNLEKMRHLKAICFVRPTAENCRHLERELQNPCYGEYHIFFSNLIKTGYLEELAEADEHELVKQVQEFYADYYAVNPDLFELRMPHVVGLRPEAKADVIERMVDCLSAVCLSLKKRPIIRYQDNSDLAHRVGSSLVSRMKEQKTLFDFRRPEVDPLLLIIDRRNDPVTPLLHQWTYQAMAHDLLGIHKNVVDLSKAPGCRDEMKQVVLSAAEDPFYKANLYSNFGDLGLNIQSLVEEFKGKTKSTQSLESISDIKRFLEEYPEFRELQQSVSKHVSLVTELSRLQKSKSLMPLSEIEQMLACKQDHSLAVKSVREALTEMRYDQQDLLKLVMLYALRYEETSGNQISNFMDMLATAGLSADEIGIIPTLLEYGGVAQRVGDLLENKTLFSVGGATLRRALKGVDCPYTEHKPQLSRLIELVFSGKLKKAQYPYLTREPTIRGSSRAGDVKPEDLIVFVIGGATYEEALAVHEFNKNSRGSASVVLGGSIIHNTDSFIEELKHASQTRDSGYSGRRRF